MAGAGPKDAPPPGAASRKTETATDQQLILLRMIDTIEALTQRLHHVRQIYVIAVTAALEERRSKNLTGKKELLHLVCTQALAATEEHERACSCDDAWQPPDAAGVPGVALEAA